jgi:N-methylhydantoinase A
LRADVVKERSQTVLRAVASAQAAGRFLRAAFARVERDGVRDMRREGFRPAQIRSERFLDMRYAGQAYELTIPANGDFVRAFHGEHERRYGYADPAREVEIVNVRARLIGRTPRVNWPRQRLGSSDAHRAAVARRRVLFAGRARETPIYERDTAPRRSFPRAGRLASTRSRILSWQALAAARTKGHEPHANEF